MDARRRESTDEQMSKGMEVYDARAVALVRDAGRFQVTPEHLSRAFVPRARPQAALSRLFVAGGLIDEWIRPAGPASR
jgi:hypothetical protein